MRLNLIILLQSGFALDTQNDKKSDTGTYGVQLKRKFS